MISSDDFLSCQALPDPKSKGRELSGTGVGPQKRYPP